jgi:hypothetical protein
MRPWSVLLVASSLTVLSSASLLSQDSIGITAVMPPLPWIVDTSTTVTVAVTYQLHAAHAGGLSDGKYRVVLAGEPSDGPSAALPRSWEIDAGVLLDSLSGTLQLSRTVAELVGPGGSADSVKIRAFLAELRPRGSPNYVSRSAALEVHVARGQGD